ncbi:MAG: hypothetical protein ABSG62_19630 [Terracidiphilus sp.]
MSNAKSSWFKWSMISVTFAMLAAFSVPMHGQSAPAVRVGNTQITGIPDDWTHHHVVFSNPGTEQEAISAGRHDQWQKVVNDPRYVIQQLRRNAQVQGPAAVDANYRAKWISEASGVGDASLGSLENAGPTPGLLRRNPRPVWPIMKIPFGPTLKNDWSVSMGAGTSGTAGVYPAKYGFAQASNNTTASCSDYVVFPTNVTTTGTVPNVIAYTNLYGGSIDCNSGAEPTVFWQVLFEITGPTTYGAVTTSPVLSVDGSEAAFMVTIGTKAYLAVVLMPNAADTSVVSITCSTTEAGATNVNNTSQTGAPQAWCAPFADGHADALSSPFVNYATNTLYVGDSNGVLHTYTNVFHTYGTGPPSTNTTAPTEGTAVTVVSGGAALGSPVYDPGSGLVFIGGANNGTGQGILHSVNSSGTVVSTGSLTGGTFGIGDAPLLDSSTGKLYVFGPEIKVGSCSSTNCTGVLQFATGTTLSGATGILAAVGVLAHNVVFYDGSFDNTYYTGSGTTGNLYVCGNAGGDAKLYQIPMSGTFGTGVTAEATLTSATNDGNSLPYQCSGVTEVLNGSDDYIFMSVWDDANLAASGANKCSGGGGCVYSFNVGSGGSETTPVDGLNATGGTGGIIIDNVVTSPSGASQVYYEDLGDTDAVQTAQSTL